MAFGSLALAQKPNLFGSAKCRLRLSRPAQIANARLAFASCDARAQLRAPARDQKLSADAELLDQILVAFLVGAPQVVEQRATLADHLEQATTGMVVLDVRLEMVGQVVDALRQDRYLHFRRPGIAGLLGIRLDHFGLAAARNRHRSSFQWRPRSAQQAGQVEYALGDDFAVVQFGQGQKLARNRDVNRTTEIGCVPSAQQYGLAPCEPCRVCPADGQRRDVVQRGLDGQEGVREARLTGRGSMAYSL